ncbi:C40 family peptidase [Tessaracoccus sp. OS52]|uniref:C40 family peptidase n=1 Tax=Tessaracoccus sp. OS52 TaxID=2886691 RepID=UPI001D118F34|nr:C40 family peptidase [Tessaracoccus sp. OS52]MCC2593754.1 C40 family peptidase [Tessaracoccus sp. OS52]
MLKKATAVAVAALVALILGVINGQNARAAEPTVYTQPGDHYVNGRYWKTACEKYSTTVVRCSTDIWGTTVINYNGRWVKHNGWVFNNLTYLPSDRAAWGSNPLANSGDWVGKDGRRWRTECDTASTGRGGCRSYAVSTTIDIAGTTYTTQKEWVINNIVTFSTASIPAVTSIPAAAPAISGVPVEKPVAASAAENVVAAALAKVGSPYVYASAGPNSFDCSGLTSYAYKQVGITLPRSSGAQFSAGTRVSRSNLKPGDLVFYYSPISHVGIYIGDGKIVDAANPRTGVRVASVDSMPFAGAVRVLG